MKSASVSKGHKTSSINVLTWKHRKIILKTISKKWEKEN